MVVMNERMRKELVGISLEGKNLPSGLSELLELGFFEMNGCVFIQSLKDKCLSVSQASFPDKTGLECFVNSVHIDDYVEFDFISYALLFIEKCFELWRVSAGGGKLAVIMSGDEFGVVVKFHILREGESWLCANIEEYDDAVFCADSSLLSFSNGCVDY